MDQCNGSIALSGLEWFLGWYTVVSPPANIRGASGAE